MHTEPTNDIIAKSRYIPFLAMLFVAVLMIVNTTASKIIQVGPFSVTGSLIIFPISYIFGDIFTEVYGYKATRKIVWAGLGITVFMSLCYWLVQIFPAAPFWTNQAAYDTILGSVPRVVLASITAYFVGEFANSYVMSKMKIWTNGSHLWSRIIGSTVVGEAIDTTLFVTIAFAGIFSTAELFTVIFSGYIIKVAYEIIAMPATYAVVRWLKRAEEMDVYDRGVNYNPFLLKE